MDLYTTLVTLAGEKPPSDRTVDGIDLSSVLFQQKTIDRPLFYYRGDELMAVRVGVYKAHLWTWTNSIEEFNHGVNFCPGEDIENVTTHDQVNNTAQPILFHLGRDPGEKYHIRPHTEEYKSVMPQIQQIVADHKNTLKPGTPQLNWCDRAVMNWSPPGCEKLGQCFKGPKSDPKKCTWPH